METASQQPEALEAASQPQAASNPGPDFEAPPRRPTRQSTLALSRSETAKPNQDQTSRLRFLGQSAVAYLKRQIDESRRRRIVRAETEEHRRWEVQLKAWLASDPLDSTGKAEEDELVSAGSSFYEPLLPETRNDDAGKPMIRLARLHPGDEWDPIEISLDISGMDTEYEALSYCWGSSLTVSPISCNGSRFDITTNLKSALRTLRSKDAVRVLWVDAICINQNNISEREQQVGIMADIFRNAQQTVVWLGDIYPGYQSAFELLRRMHIMHYEKIVEEGDGYFPIIDKTEYTPLDDGKNPEFARFEESASLQRLLALPWFERVWIIQEVSLSACVLLVCGTESMPWDLFAQSILCMDLHGMPQTYVRSPKFDVVYCLDEARKGVLADDAQETTLLHLLNRFRESQATDPRDKIFGILAMTSSDTNALSLRPDYRASLEDVYCRAASGLLNSGPYLDVLSIPKPFLQSTTSTSNLPSWCPNWAAAGPMPVAFRDTGLVTWVMQDSTESDSTEDSSMPLFNACRFHLSPSPVYDPEHRKVTLCGYQIDRVKSLCPITEDTSTDIDTIMAKAVEAVREGSMKSYMDFIKWTFATVHSSMQAFLRSTVVWEASVLGTRQEHKDTVYATTGERLEKAYVTTIQADARLFDDETAMTMFGQRLKWNRFMYWQYKHGYGDSRVVSLAVTLVLFMSVFFQERPTVYLLDYVHWRRLSWSEGGLLALMPHDAEIGDEIWLLKGSRVPLVLRPTVKGSEERKLVGAAYVHGVMYGEHFDETRCGDITLV